jgi:hypothetical protein
MPPGRWPAPPVDLRCSRPLQGLSQLSLGHAGQCIGDMETVADRYWQPSVVAATATQSPRDTKIAQRPGEPALLSADRLGICFGGACVCARISRSLPPVSAAMRACLHRRGRLGLLSCRQGSRHDQAHGNAESSCRGIARLPATSLFVPSIHGSVAASWAG